MSTKSWPSAPSPCIQMMLAMGDTVVSISIAASWSATVRPSAVGRSRHAHRRAGRLGEVDRLERRGGPAVAIGQGREAEAPLDQLQHGGVIVLAAADEAALRVGRHDQGGHARPPGETVPDRPTPLIATCSARVLCACDRDSTPITAAPYPTPSLRASTRSHAV